MTLKTSFAEYTESEFLELIYKIIAVNGVQGDEVLIPLLDHFESISEHPSGTDLFFWPAPGHGDTPEDILREVKAWREQNGKPGFKQVG